MEFKFETAYNQTATTIMARALRKTVRKKRSRRSHIWGVLVETMEYFIFVFSQSHAQIYDKKSITS